MTALAMSPVVHSQPAGRPLPRWRLQSVVAIVGAAVLLAPGCGGGSGRPKLKSVEGVVKLNGEPLEGADVFLQPIVEGNAKYRRASQGTTDAQGKFALGTYGVGDGVPEGKYRVAVIKQEPVGGYPENYDAENPELTPFRMSWITPRKYADPQTSGLEVEITSSGMQPPTLELESTGKPEVELIGARRRGDGT